MSYIQTDGRGRMTLPGGKANQLYLIQEDPDGTIHLQPAVVVSAAQAALDNNPALLEELEKSHNSGASPRNRRRNRTAQAS